jgi:hypothetical protein
MEWNNTHVNKHIFYYVPEFVNILKDYKIVALTDIDIYIYLSNTLARQN